MVMDLKKKFGIIMSILGNLLILWGLFNNYDVDLLLGGVLVVIVGLILKHYNFLKNYFRDCLVYAINERDKEDEEHK